MDNTYCTECGTLMLKEEVNANDVHARIFNFEDTYIESLDTKFDPDNGKKNIALYFHCPQYKETFFSTNKHTAFVWYKNTTYHKFRIKKQS